MAFFHSNLTDTVSLDEKIVVLQEWIKQADAILIGAGAGLSAADGFLYQGPRFELFFSDSVKRYGFHDMYNAGFYAFPTLEEKWGYWSRQIFLNRYLDQPGEAYQMLHKLVDGKEYFVLTTNVDHCFQRSTFKHERMFYTQGDYGLWQCAEPCHYKTYDNKEMVLQMVKQQFDCKIPSDLIPKCPICGKPMKMNLRMDSSFVEDDGWHMAEQRYRNFLSEHLNENILFLELGVGYNSPGVIKYPFWNFVANNPDARLVSIDLHCVFVPDYIQDQSLLIKDDIVTVLKKCFT